MSLTSARIPHLDVADRSIEPGKMSIEAVADCCLVLAFAAPVHYIWIPRSVLRTVGMILKRLAIRPQIDLLRPGRTLLFVDEPISLGDGVEAEQPILAALFDEVRRAP